VAVLFLRFFHFKKYINDKRLIISRDGENRALDRDTTAAKGVRNGTACNCEMAGSGDGRLVFWRGFASRTQSLILRSEAKLDI